MTGVFCTECKWHAHGCTEDGEEVLACTNMEMARPVLCEEFEGNAVQCFVLRSVRAGCGFEGKWFEPIGALN